METGKNVTSLKYITNRSAGQQFRSRSIVAGELTRYQTAKGLAIIDFANQTIA